MNGTIAASAAAPAVFDGSHRVAPLDRWARRLLFNRLRRFDHGRLTITDWSGSHEFGSTPTPTTAQITVRDPRVYRQLALGGDLGAAKAYLRGSWDSDDLTKVFRLLLRNRETSTIKQPFWAKPTRLLRWLSNRERRNTRRGSRDNIHAHYDLGNDLFELMLDETMCYSSGVFPSADSTLREGSEHKLRLICEKLRITPNDHVLEIGAGWGGFALLAAREYGCRVTATTISDEQFLLARRRVDEAGLRERVTLLKQDYRDLHGQYDKLVSIEMIEAVGAEYLPTFFKCCGRLLKPEGAFALQAITMADHRYDRYLRSVDFIREYIFPGGCLPSVSSMTSAIAKGADFRMTHFEEITAHYIRTLKCWRERFRQRLGRVRELGYDDAFIRLWEYYLAYCEAGFEERHCGAVQMVLAKPKCRIEGK